MVFKIIPLISLLFTLGCSSTEDNMVFQESDVGMYNQGLKLLKSENYEKSVEIFNELELQHPYSDLASKGQVMAGFSLYSDNKYDEAILTLSKFIELNPNHQLVPYALYLKGFSYFERMPNVNLDQKFSERAYETFSELQNRFPKSVYANKSINHIKTLRNHLASKELKVGKFYQSEGYLLAGLKRYKNILKNYRNTIHVPESIYRIIECYISLGLKKQVIYLYKILNYNFSGSEWDSETKKLIKKHKIDFKSKDFEKKELDLKKLDKNDFDLI